MHKNRLTWFSISLENIPTSYTWFDIIEVEFESWLKACDWKVDSFLRRLCTFHVLWFSLLLLEMLCLYFQYLIRVFKLCLEFTFWLEGFSTCSWYILLYNYGTICTIVDSITDLFCIRNLQLVKIYLYLNWTVWKYFNTIVLLWCLNTFFAFILIIFLFIFTKICYFLTLLLA